MYSSNYFEFTWIIGLLKNKLIQIQYIGEKNM